MVTEIDKKIDSKIPGINPITGLPKPVNCVGKPGRSGRPKSDKTKLEECLKRINDKSIEIIDVMINKALAGDLIAAQSLLDRAWGKATQRTETHVDIEIGLTPAQLLANRMAVLAQQQQLLTQALPDANNNVIDADYQLLKGADHE